MEGVILIIAWVKFVLCGTDPPITPLQPKVAAHASEPSELTHPTDILWELVDYVDYNSHVVLPDSSGNASTSPEGPLVLAEVLPCAGADDDVR